MTDAKTHDADFQGSFFALEIDALTLGWFTGCSGLSLEFDVTTYKEGNGKKVIERKRPGKPKYSEVVAQARLHHQQGRSTTGSRRSSTPRRRRRTRRRRSCIYDRQQTECARFSLEACWPSKMSVSDLSSGSDDVMVEELTIQHEFLDWVKP